MKLSTTKRTLIKGKASISYYPTGVNIQNTKTTQPKNKQLKISRGAKLTLL